MIIRKPYAFLIKHFRLIHGLLFAIFVYTTIKTFGIYSFFNDYAIKHYFTNSMSLVSEHISTLMYISCALIVLLCSGIYYLLSFKNKKRGIYLLSILYSIILCGFYIYISYVLKGLITKTLNVETVRALRDICMIVVIPQIILLFIFLTRALGFNLKQFDFKKDMEDLKIEAADNEEVELTIGNNSYIYKRYFAKARRLFGYFVQENKFFLTALLSITLLAISLTIYFNIKVYNVKYDISKEIYANNLWYKVNNVYLTNKDISGRIIDSTKYYVIVDVNIKNKTKNNQTLSSELFRLDDGVEVLTPKYNMDKQFTDFGNIFAPMDIIASTEKNVNVIFEIEKKRLKKEYLFKISNVEPSINYTSKSKLQYSDIIVNPINVDDKTEGYNYHLQENIDLSNTLLNKSNIKIVSYTINDSFKDNYEYCLNKDCYTKTFIISPTDKEKNSILKLKGNYNVDNDIYMKKYLNSLSSIFEYFGMIKYRYQGEVYTEKINKASVAYEKNENAYFEVSNKVSQANKIELILTIRGKIITIILK